MASYSVTSDKHATLSASTVDTVTLGSEFNLVNVLNRSTTGEIHATADGSTPTVGGDNTKVIPPNYGSLTFDVPTSGATVVKLICATANAYSVSGF